MRNMKRVEFQIEIHKGLKGLCESIYNQLNDKDIDFGNSYQITVSKKDVFTNVMIDYIEQSKEPDSVGLTVQKKEILNDLLGSASTPYVDFNKVREEYKKES